ncbi:DUF6350 family protein [Streptomyces hoynatensis]|uniref:Integral membrane protein n=1 Tax=Streptomyces hoynatensis TaxID=1141874 RepID=A0A3A9ZEU8_9ACTN|nr:DUF6350 family protein [Streptomyces hoynatensis]RKN46858.1 hypothetical protein D7294_01180 [Streptomyces hoynatensis]
MRDLTSRTRRPKDRPRAGALAPLQGVLPALGRCLPPGRFRLRWLFDGALAAVLGIGAVAAVVLSLWTLSPYPDTGADGALRVAADLWLLGHGTELVRPAAASGGAPVGLTPLLLAALSGWLLYRSARGSLEPDPLAGEPGAEPGEGPRAAFCLTVGYLLVAAAAVAYTLPGELRADPWSAAWHLPLFALACTLAAACATCGIPPAPAWARRLPGPATLRAAARAAVAGTGAYCAAGAALAALALACHARAAGDSFGRLGSGWSGWSGWCDLGGLALLVLALLPNAAVWAVAYALGPGFSLGVHGAVGPLDVRGEPALPDFPLLAALPEGTPGGAPAWVALALVPAAGVGVTAWRAGREAPAGRLPAAGTALLAACGAGAFLGALAALSGGPLGGAELAGFGPEGRSTALAVAAWTAALGAPLALLLRLLPTPRPRPLGALRARLRRPAPRLDPEAERWHTTAARHSRWAALKKSSGTLVPDFPDFPDVTDLTGPLGLPETGGAGEAGDLGPGGSRDPAGGPPHPGVPGQDPPPGR